MSDQQLSSVIRVKRKRNAPASSGWMVSSKRNRLDDSVEDEKGSVFKLALTAPDPSISNISNILPQSKVELVEYDLEKGIFRKQGIVDEDQEKIDDAVHLVEKMDVSDSPDLDPSKNRAPLASNESLEDEQYVYDFYYSKPSAFSSVQIDLNQELSIRQATDEELQLMFMDDDDDSDAVNDDDADSNDEGNPVNDYPDEGEFDDNHSTTSDEYDHYNDGEEAYEGYVNDDD